MIEGITGLGMDTVIAVLVLFVIMLGTTIWCWMTPDKKPQGKLRDWLDR